MIKNRATEADIKNWLDLNGWYGSSATFQEIELHAIKRPGWLQVFRFQCQAKSRSDQQWAQLWGAVKDDETQLREESKIIVVAYADPGEQQEQLTKWAEEIHGPAGRPVPANWFAVAFMIAVCLAMIGGFVLARAFFGY